MKQPQKRQSWFWSGCFLFCWIIIIGICGCARDAGEQTYAFDIKQGFAPITLKEAARQAEVEFIFSSDLVKDLETSPIKGRYTPSEALELMLIDSPYTIVRHTSSGVYSIKKRPLEDAQNLKLEE